MNSRVSIMTSAQRDDEGARCRSTALLALDDERAINLLRYWMRSLGLQAASTARIGDVLRQLRDAAATATATRCASITRGIACAAYRGAIFWEKGDSADPADLDEGAPRAAHGESIATGRARVSGACRNGAATFVFEPCDAAGDADAVSEASLRAAPLCARSRAGGERLRLAARMHPSRTLKNLFQERGVPAWKRDVPLLFLGETLLFVPSDRRESAVRRRTERIDDGPVSTYRVAARSADRLIRRSELSCPISVGHE